MKNETNIAVVGILTADETIDYLRFNTLGSNPHNTLKYYVGKGLLKPTRIGGKNFFTQQSCDDFCKAMTK